MQPGFTVPDFVKNNSADEIHRRMMSSLPDDIDDTPGGFPSDFTKPAAIEKAELIEFHIMRTIMLAFPQYAWDEWLDLHGKQVHLTRKSPVCASGHIMISGVAGTELAVGTVFCTPATDLGPSVEFATNAPCIIGESGNVLVDVTAVEPGPNSDVKAGVISLMAKPVKGVISITNPEPITGGSERESNDDFYDRIAVEYENSKTYLGNDQDYIRWAKEAGAGDCIVVPVYRGPGTVKLVLVDGNGQPANERLIQDVYQYIVSSEDRSKRLLPTACAELSCVAATTVGISYECTGLLYHETDLMQIKEEFLGAVQKVYANAKKEGVLRYNDVRPILSRIGGVDDFDTFLMNGSMENIRLDSEAYPQTDQLVFS